MCSREPGDALQAVTCHRRSLWDFVTNNFLAENHGGGARFESNL
jgi:hypothetical protein